MSPYTYDRIPNLNMTVTLNTTHGSIIQKNSHVDSIASYSVTFEPIIYGEIPMTITLDDTQASDVRKKKRDNRLKNSQIIINRAFSPKPIPYSYYQHNKPSEDFNNDTSRYSTYLSDYELNEITIKKRFSQKSQVFYNRPELTIDYTKEWNFILDRGTPWGNGQRIISYKHNPEYRFNFPSLTYSLQRLGATSSATIKTDSTYIQHGSMVFYHSYIMPKTIKVYSNLLGRERFAKAEMQSSNRIRYYLVVDRYKRSESPHHPPFLSKHGVRHTYYEGYSRVVSFYSPDYSECALPDSADYRRTLYWNPDIWTDMQGRSSISFYNNARTKRLHIRAEGFTRNGEFIVYDSDKQNNETN